LVVATNFQCIMLLLGSTAVLAASYSFYFDDLTMIVRSANVKKEKGTTAGTVTQTGASPGTYTTYYSIYLTSSNSVLTNEKAIASTSRQTTLVPYASSGYYDFVENCYLKGRYSSPGNNAVTVNGIWNP